MNITEARIWAQIEKKKRKDMKRKGKKRKASKKERNGYERKEKLFVASAREATGGSFRGVWSTGACVTKCVLP